MVSFLNNKVKLLLISLSAIVVLILVSLIYQGGFFGEKKVLEISGIQFNVDVAKTLAEQRRGLSGRAGLADNQGMFFIFDKPNTYGFWMKDMKFPIDIIWLKDNKIIRFEENMAPQNGAKDSELKIYYPPEPIQKVLEVKAGAVQRFGFKIGDEVGYNK